MASVQAPRRGMVMTVGTGTRPDSDIVAPLIKSIGDANPDVVVLVTTAVSAPFAAAIQERCTVPSVEWLEERLPAADDIEGAFQGCLAAIRQLLARGIPTDRVTVDYTSGTKTMTAALVMAAVALRCGSLRYISGTRVSGVVAAGTERFLSTPPAAILALADLQLAEELMSRLEFHEAARLCTSVNVHLLSKEDKERREALELAAHAYQAWDRFRHHEAKRLFEKLQATAGLPERFRVDARVIQRLGGIGNAVHRRCFKPDLLADLVANAERRMCEGRWDDAVGRLYRVTEMLAQRRLKEHYDIDTSAVRLEQLPEQFRARFAREDRAERVTLALRQSYELLNALGDPLGQRFTANAFRLLGERNESILAHGTKPIGEGAARELHAEVVTFAVQELADFRQRCNELQFPWMRGNVLPV